MSKSTLQHHAEWIQLVDTSGPFLSLDILTDAFPQGLPALDADPKRHLRDAYAAWQQARAPRRASDALASPDPKAAAHQWVRYVLDHCLGLAPCLRWDQGIPQRLMVTSREHGERISPHAALIDGDQTPRLLIMISPPGHSLRAQSHGASAEQRMIDLLLGAGVACGLLTNGEDWRLLYARPGQAVSAVTFSAAMWAEEPLTLRAFVALLSLRRFTGVEAQHTLEQLYARSASHEAEVTNRLGAQVRRAIEVLLQTLDRIDRGRGRALLRGVPEATLYEAAITVMMRLVFLLCAEARELLLPGDEVWEAHYAVTPLMERLREVADQNGEELLERRYGAWCRLLSTFRAVHGGISHDRLRLRAYGGSLFDPDRFAFLEGRACDTSWRDAPADPIEVDDRTVLHLLEALQQVPVKGGRDLVQLQKVSFSALNEEQIGYVYEGLLDHAAERARSPVLGLRAAKDQVVHVALCDLEARAADSPDALIGWLTDKTGRTSSALTKDVERGRVPVVDAHTRSRWLRLCDNDDALLARVEPFGPLVAFDTYQDPVIVPAGSFFVTQGLERRRTGTHYTPPELTKQVVQYALEPLIYSGPAVGAPRAQWALRSSTALLALRICDPAMGSGAFLAQACRSLAQRVVEAWEGEAAALGPDQRLIIPQAQASEGVASELLLPADPTEREVLARRLVAERCLYGVDLNPMAVEIAKLSLWLVTLQRDRAFGFLDHALRCGDSLLGITDEAQLRRFHIDPAHTPRQRAGDFYQFFWGTISDLDAAKATRLALAAFTVIDAHDASKKAALLAESRRALTYAHAICDLLVGYALKTAPRPITDFDDAIITHDADFTELIDRNAINTPRKQAVRDAFHHLAADLLTADLPPHVHARLPFHWCLEFPEIINPDAAPSAPPNASTPPKGFDAIIGNPPFRGGKKLTGDMGDAYREYLVRYLGGGQRGSADLCAYFFLRAFSLLKPGGTLGLVATNTIAQGDTREVGLAQMVAQKLSITRAIRSMPWPGEANLEVALVWGIKAAWAGTFTLDEQPVSAISSYLDVPSQQAQGEPLKLKANQGKSFIGSYVLGLGFTMSPEDAAALIAKNPANQRVLAPYLNGKDLNTSPTQTAPRWVINFQDWPLDRSAAGSWSGASERERKKYLQIGLVPADYPDPVAADYPDCLAIVERDVKPERTRKKADGSFVLRSPLFIRWWHYADKRPELYATIQGMDRVLVKTRVSDTLAFEFAHSQQVFSEATVVFATQQAHFLCLLQSSLHEIWARRYASTLETRIRYTPTDCFDTFPFPPEESLAELEEIGERYHAHRQEVMTQSNKGLTKTYNRFHDPKEKSAEIETMRGLHREMDEAVMRAYGWGEVVLGHGFDETAQGMRYTISEAARAEVLGRLLALNHARHAQEVEAGQDPPDTAADDGLADEEEEGSASASLTAPVSGAAAKGAAKEAKGATPRPKPQRQRQASLLKEVPALGRDAKGQGALSKTVFQSFQPGEETQEADEAEAAAAPSDGMPPLTPNGQKVRHALEAFAKQALDVSTLSRVTRVSPIEVLESLKALVAARLVTERKGKYQWG
jgi:hypothetical protein